MNKEEKREVHLLRAEKILKEMRGREGGTLRLNALQVCDAMHDLIWLMEEEKNDTT